MRRVLSLSGALFAGLALLGCGEDASKPKGTGSGSLIRLSVDSLVVNETARVALLELEREGALHEECSVKVQSASGTATSPFDFSDVGGFVTFPADSARRTVRIPVWPDEEAEPDEQFTATLSSPSEGSTIEGNPTLIVTVTDLMPDFALVDENPASPSAGQEVSPASLRPAITVWYFGVASSSFSQEMFAELEQLAGAVDGLLGAGAPEIRTLGVNRSGEEGSNAAITAGRVLPWLQDRETVAAWNLWNSDPEDVVLVDGEGRRIVTLNLAQHPLTRPSAHDSLRSEYLLAAGQPATFAHFAEESITVFEMTGIANPAILREGAIRDNGSVYCRIVPGTATVPDDFADASRQVAWFSTYPSVNFVMALVKDDLIEEDESFDLVLESPSEGITLTDPKVLHVTLTDRAQDFALEDVNGASPRAGETVSPRDYLEKVSAWYFGHST